MTKSNRCPVRRGDSAWYSISWTLGADALQIFSVLHSINVENVFTNFFHIAGRVEKALCFDFFLNTPKSHLDTRKHDNCFKSLASTSVCAAKRAHLSHSGLSYGSGDLQAEGLLSAQEGKVAFSAFVGIVASVSTLWTEDNGNITNALGCEEPFIFIMCLALH